MPPARIRPGSPPPGHRAAFPGLPAAGRSACFHTPRSQGDGRCVCASRRRVTPCPPVPKDLRSPCLPGRPASEVGAGRIPRQGAAGRKQAYLSPWKRISGKSRRQALREPRAARSPKRGAGAAGEGRRHNRQPAAPPRCRRTPTCALPAQLPGRRSFFRMPSSTPFTNR